MVLSGGLSAMVLHTERVMVLLERNSTLVSVLRRKKITPNMVDGSFNLHSLLQLLPLYQDHLLNE